MYLTKKSFRKILIMAICYFALGSISIILSLLFNSIGVSDNFLLILGIIIYLLGFLMFLCGWYAEGEAKLINLGNKLVRNELKPKEFIEHYEKLKTSNDLVIKKPSVDVLRVALVAYDLLDDRENALATVDEISWNLKDSTASVTITSDIEQTITVSCGISDKEETISLKAGETVTVKF